MTTYVVNVVAVVSKLKLKLKFIFFDGSRHSQCSGEMKYINHRHGVVNVVAIGT